MTNIGEDDQVKKSRKKAKIDRQEELGDLRSILNLPQGRRIIWRFLSKAGVFKSIWSSSAAIHYNAGQQDFGHFILGEVTEADQESLFKMMREQKLREEGNEQI